MDVILDVYVYYRCKGCGKMDAPSVIDPSDDYPPETDCPCYNGPNWERGIWMVSPA